MTKNELSRKFPNASKAFLEANCEAEFERICAPEHKLPKGSALDDPSKGEDKNSSRFEIVFTIYSFRGFDWDNAHTKILQDHLVRIGILHADSWDVLQGKVITQKVSTKDEERTEVEVFEINL